MQVPQRRPITRNRELLACSECRKRKLKCDRNVPCGSCSRRDNGGSCTYERFARNERERERRLEAEARLEHLEGLVQQLAATQSSEPSGRPSQVASSEQWSVANTAESSSGLAYSGSTHWSSMLEDIEELRAIAAEDSQLVNSLPELTEGDGTAFLFGASQPLPYEQILHQYLPPRQDADKLVASYFRSTTIAAPCVHAGHFNRRYQQFWVNPESAPPLWTSLLFTICHIASTTLSARLGGNEPKNRHLVAAAQCLAVGKYYKPQQFAVESLLLYAQATALSGVDIVEEHGTLMSSVIHLATQSGYHRDPDRFSLSLFDREMRRRTWSLCMQLDLLIAFSLGLPSNVQSPTWDTCAPRNLLDVDFDENIEELPASRADSEPTGMIFYIAKHKLMSVFEKILRHALSTTTSAFQEPEALEAELSNTYSSLPRILHPRTVTDSLTDSPSLIITRICVLFLYQKSRCVLHRKYAVQGRRQSIITCYDASSTILQYFLDVYHELQPGGQLEKERWFGSTLTWQDFLLGIMVLCLVLAINHQELGMPDVDPAVSADRLRRAQAICSNVSYKSKDTFRVLRLVDATLLRLDLGSYVESHSLNSTNGNAMANNTCVTYAAHGEGPRGTSNDFWYFDHGDTVQSFDDASWTYLERYLNLPNDDHTLDL